MAPIGAINSSSPPIIHIHTHTHTHPYISDDASKEPLFDAIKLIAMNVHYHHCSAKINSKMIYEITPINELHISAHINTIIEIKEYVTIDTNRKESERKSDTFDWTSHSFDTPISTNTKPRSYSAATPKTNLKNRLIRIKLNAKITQSADTAYIQNYNTSQPNTPNTNNKLNLPNINRNLNGTINMDITSKSHTLLTNTNDNNKIHTNTNKMFTIIIRKIYKIINDGCMSCGVVNSFRFVPPHLIVQHLH